MTLVELAKAGPYGPSLVILSTGDRPVVAHAHGHDEWGEGWRVLYTACGKPWFLDQHDWIAADLLNPERVRPCRNCVHAVGKRGGVR